MTVIEIILALVAAFGWLGWWITGRFGLELNHRHRIIEEHTKAIHKYVEQYYIPYIVLSREIERTLSLKQPLKTMQQKESFFRLAQWFYVRHKWSRDVGNIIILRDPTAEKLLGSLSGFQSRFFGAGKPVGVVQRHMLMNVLDSQKKLRYFFNEFNLKLNQQPLRPIFQKYRKWLTSNKPEISLLAKELRCFHTLFYFEINMCYKTWYGRKPVKPKVDFNLVKGKLDELQNEGKIRFNDKKRYLRKLGYKGLVI